MTTQARGRDADWSVDDDPWIMEAYRTPPEDPMQAPSRDWLAGLEAFVADWRRQRPARDDPSSGPEASAERAILAAHLVSWFDGLAAVQAARRRHVAGGAGDPDCPIVLTTSAVGSAVAESLLAGGHPVAAAEAGRIIPVTELEYRLWCIRHPDERYDRHVNHWNCIKTRVPPQRAAEFARHPLGPGEAYWLHRTGTAGAGAADRRDCHLWKWNGVHAALVEPFVREGGVSTLADRRPAGGDD
jgi:hypothetical protein